MKTVSNLNNRKILDNGAIVVTSNLMLDLIADKKTTQNICVEKDTDIQKCNSLARFNGWELIKDEIPYIEPDFGWIFPEQYKKVDILDYIRSLSRGNDTERIEYEIRLYQDTNSLDLLRFVNYLVTTMRANGVVWGVGRGSSVSSYLLYLLGLHKINSLTYELDPHEFFKKI